MLEQIRALLKASPFRPFSIHSSSGEVFRVSHPENAAVVGHWIVALLPDGETAIMLSPLHITGVSGVEPALA